MIPESLNTARLLLRCWNASDAHALAPILEANVHRLGGWIPAHVASAAPVAELERRLSRFAEKFRDNRAWRFAIFSRDDSGLLGEVSLFPRTAEKRTPLAEADRVEIGYWLREEATGFGYVTEAAQALVDLARTITGVQLVEIRCDPANVPSAAVPRRLGFTLEESGAPSKSDMIWRLRLDTR